MAMAWLPVGAAAQTTGTPRVTITRGTHTVTVAARTERVSVRQTLTSTSFALTATDGRDTVDISGNSEGQIVVRRGGQALGISMRDATVPQVAAVRALLHQSPAASEAMPALTIEPLFTEELVAAVGVGHRLAYRAALPLEALRDEDFILTKSGSAIRDTILAACAVAGFAPRIAFESGAAATVRALAAAGLGVAILPRSEALTGGPPLAAIEWLGGARPAPSAGAVAGVLYLGVVITALGYLVWNWALARVSAPRASIFLTVQPIGGAVLGGWVAANTGYATTLWLAAATLVAALVLTLFLRAPRLAPSTTPPAASR